LGLFALRFIHLRQLARAECEWRGGITPWARNVSIFCRREMLRCEIRDAPRRIRSARPATICRLMIEETAQKSATTANARASSSGGIRQGDALAARGEDRKQFGARERSELLQPRQPVDAVLKRANNQTAGNLPAKRTALAAPSWFLWEPL
jgi:hypothetical protein